MNMLEASDLDALIAALEQRGVVTIETSGKVGYSL
jgi:hypothetical protein